MATKVKGDAIKEGSIPLSALSSEVQEKIENSGSKVFVFTYDMVKSENEDGSLTIDPANAIEMINSDFINMMDVYNLEKTYTYDDFTVFSFTLKLDPLMSQVIVMHVYSEGVIVITSAGEEHPFVYDSDSEENENKVYKRLSLLDLALGDSDSKDYTEYIDEVKENVKKNLGITDAVTPDWNAQKGEAGYIEGRTHFFEWHVKPEDENFNDLLLGLKDKTPISVTDNGYIRVVKYLAEECYSMWEQGFEYFDKSWKSHSYGILDGFVTVPDILGGSASPKISISLDYDDDGNELIYVTIHWSTEYTTDDVNEIIDQICHYYYIIPYQNYNIGQLNDKYISSNIARKSDIPNDIIKTTPQTLSNTDKNQALSNLGIDPVVLKYIINPFILQTGRIVPDELIASNGVSFKYPYAGMYNWAKGYAYDKDNFEYANGSAGDFGSVHCFDGYIYGAGNEIPSEGLPTSSSDLDNPEGPYGLFHNNYNDCFTTGAWLINKDTKQCYLTV